MLAVRENVMVVVESMGGMVYIEEIAHREWEMPLLLRMRTRI